MIKLTLSVRETWELAKHFLRHAEDIAGDHDEDGNDACVHAILTAGQISADASGAMKAQERDVHVEIPDRYCNELTRWGVLLDLPSPTAA